MCYPLEELVQGFWFEECSGTPVETTKTFALPNHLRPFVRPGTLGPHLGAFSLYTSPVRQAAGKQWTQGVPAGIGRKLPSMLHPQH